MSRWPGDPVQWTETREPLPGTGEGGRVRWTPHYYAVHVENSNYTALVWKLETDYHFGIFERGVKIYEWYCPKATLARQMAAACLETLVLYARKVRENE